MAHVVFAWELGGGFGHVAPHVPVIDALQQRGHTVSFISRNIGTARALLQRKNVRLFQSPRPAPPHQPVARPVGYAQILFNCGFDRPEHLLPRVRIWQSLFRRLAPDVIVFDHAPTALLAARATTARKVTLGTGFFVPPDDTPLPSYVDATGPETDFLRRSEQGVLAVINVVLRRLRMPLLSRLAELFGVDDHVLRTYPELDHYLQRRNGNYVGMLPTIPGADPVWPDGSPVRVFAYLKPFPELPAVLEALRALPASVLVFCPRAPVAFQRQFGSSRLRITNQPIDIPRVARHCRFAVLNGTHDTAAALLTAGIPALHFPLTPEQNLCARRFVETGTAIAHETPHPGLIAESLHRLLESDELIDAARRFATRHATESPAARLERAVACIVG